MYKKRRTLHIEDLLNSDIPELEDMANFLSKMSDLGYNDIKQKVVISPDFLDYIKDHDCLKEWLLKGKYITHKLVTRTIKLEIKTKDEPTGLWHRVNAELQNFNPYIKHMTEDKNAKETAKEISDQIWAAYNLLDQLTKIREEENNG